MIKFILVRDLPMCSQSIEWNGNVFFGWNQGFGSS
jgi:hypothetical protein